MTSTSFATIELINDPRGFATLWPNRPDKHNAFNPQVIRELITAQEPVDADARLRSPPLPGLRRRLRSGSHPAWMPPAPDLGYTHI
ncbi:gamma-carboxygeranoyl-CoA hydratase, partial [Pseudomonas syringae]